MKDDRLWERDDFSVIVSLDPPKGIDLTDLIGKAQMLKGRVDAVLIEDCADAIMRMTPPAACHALAQEGVLPVLGLNSRDRNRLAFQGDLLGAWSLGVRNVLYRTGRDPSYGDHPQTKPVRDLTGVEAVGAINSLNSGQDCAGQSLKGSPNFSIAVQVELLDDDAQTEKTWTQVEQLAQKGVKSFVISPQFDIERTKTFIKRGKGLGVSLVVGVMLLKSVGMARYLNEVPGVSKVPNQVIEKMVKAPVKPRAGVEVAIEFINELQGLAQGVVLLPIGWNHKIPEILEGIGR